MLGSLEGLGVLSTTVAASYTREIKKHNFSESVLLQKLPYQTRRIWYTRFVRRTWEFVNDGGSFLHKRNKKA